MCILKHWQFAAFIAMYVLCFGNDVSGTLQSTLKDTFYSEEVHFETGNGQGDKDFCLLVSIFCCNKIICYRLCV